MFFWVNFTGLGAAVVFLMVINHRDILCERSKNFAGTAPDSESEAPNSLKKQMIDDGHTFFNIHIYIYTYIYIHTHIYIYVYIYTYIYLHLVIDISPVLVSIPWCSFRCQVSKPSTPCGAPIQVHSTEESRSFFKERNLKFLGFFGEDTLW